MTNIKISDTGIKTHTRIVNSESDWVWHSCECCGKTIGAEGIEWHEDGECCTEIH